VTAPRFAIWGTFDVDNYGDHLFPRVAISEISRRIPGAVVDAYSPYGWLHPTPLDDAALPVSPLGPWSAERAGTYADAYDTVLVGGGELIHLNDPLLAAVYGTSAGELDRLAPSRWFVEGLGGGPPETNCPVVWHGVGVPDDLARRPAERVRRSLAGRPYVTVRDRFSQRRLERAGVAGEVAVVPDSALLLDRLLPPRTLRRRLARLRAAGHYAPGPAVVVQGCDLLVPHALEIGAALRRWLASRPGAAPDVVLLETGRCRGDALFAAALADRLAPHRIYRMPPLAGVADIAAAIAAADAFVGSSLHGAISATVYGRPFVILNPAGESKLDGFADLAGFPDRVLSDLGGFRPAVDAALAAPVPARTVVGLQRRVDAHFDRVAAMGQVRLARLGATRGGSPGCFG
jgi:polysaccharide pyruvyl transferase WcaK-like protein